MASDEVQNNQESYERLYQADLEQKHKGLIALMHNQELVAVYNNEADAYTTGVHFYGLGNFSLIRIGESPVHLGIQTVSMLSS